MVFPRARLVVSACLFLAWLTFLGVLAYRNHYAVILARPQLLMSDLVVVAELGEQQGRAAREIAVRQVLWPRDAKLPARLEVLNLGDLGPRQGFRGPGTYLVPLLRQSFDANPSYLATPMPTSTGFKPTVATLQLTGLPKDFGEIADFLAQQLRLEAGEVQRHLRQVAEGQAWSLAQELTPAEARDLAHEIQTRGGTAQVIERELRIYLWTADVQAQVAELYLDD